MRKFLLLLLLCLIITKSYSQTKKGNDVPKTKSTSTYNRDTMMVPQGIVQRPLFQGKSPIISFTNWISRNMEYPEGAQKMGIEGSVEVRFTIDETGEVTDVMIVKEAHHLLDIEALRLISMSPKWEPAILNDSIPVKFGLIIPIKFKLE